MLYKLLRLRLSPVTYIASANICGLATIRMSSALQCGQLIYVLAARCAAGLGLFGLS